MERKSIVLYLLRFISHTCAIYTYNILCYLSSETEKLNIRFEKNILTGELTKFVPDPDTILLVSRKARRGPQNVLKRVLKMVMFVVDRLALLSPCTSLGSRWPLLGFRGLLAEQSPSLIAR